MTKDNSSSVISTEDLQSAINNPTTKGVLTRVYKLFMKAFGKDLTAVWNVLMERYVNDPNNNIPNDRSKQTSAKGNAKREYLASQLSWPKFIEAMKFAGFGKLEIIFRAQDSNGEMMQLTEVIDFSIPEIPDFDQELVNGLVSRPDQATYTNVKAADARAVAMAGRRPVTSTTPRGRDWMGRANIDVNKIIDDNTVKSLPIKEEDIPF